MANINFNKKKNVEWADLRVFMSGVEVTNLLGLTYKASKVKDHIMVEGDEPADINGGNRAYAGQIKLLRSSVDAMNLAAKAAGGTDLLDITVDIVASYLPSGTRVPIQDTLVNVSFEDYEFGFDQGATSMPVTIPFKFLRLISKVG